MVERSSEGGGVRVRSRQVEVNLPLWNICFNMSLLGRVGSNCHVKENANYPNTKRATIAFLNKEFDKDSVPVVVRPERNKTTMTPQNSDIHFVPWFGTDGWAWMS